MKSLELLSDEELTEKYRSGESAACDFLMEKYKGLVKSRARQLYIEGGDRDDLLQEGMIGLFKAVCSYDTKNRASFFTFADKCIANQMYKAIEASGRKKHSILNESVSFSVMRETEPALSPDPEEIVLHNEEVRDLKNGIIGLLSPMERKVFELFLEGYDYHQIARLIGKSEKSIDNALQRIRIKVKERESEASEN